jgi:hypothetical protein
MPVKLDISQITDEEAGEFRIAQLTKLKLTGDKRVTIITGFDEKGNPSTMSYMLSEAAEHIRAYLNGTPDPIGEHEIKYAKKEIAYERGSRRSTPGLV